MILIEYPLGHIARGKPTNHIIPTKFHLHVASLLVWQHAPAQVTQTMGFASFFEKLCCHELGYPKYSSQKEWLTCFYLSQGSHHENYQVWCQPRGLAAILSLDLFVCFSIPPFYVQFKIGSQQIAWNNQRYVPSSKFGCLLMSHWWFSLLQKSLAAFFP